MNITITGKPCSGKSTIANNLVERYGFKRIGVGDIFKAEANKRGMSAEEFNAFCMNNPEFDYFIDNETKRLGEELEGQNVIFDSRLAWHFVKNSFKIFIDVEDDETARRLLTSDRVGKEKYDTFEDAKKSLLNRRKLEIERYKKIYDIDLADLSQFDCVMDSTYKNPEECTEEIWEQYCEFVKKQEN